MPRAGGGDHSAPGVTFRLPRRTRNRVDPRRAPTDPMIIHSLLDTDLYKFTMMQVVLHHFPGAQVEYRFKCRSAGVDLTPYIDEIEREIQNLCALRFTPRELAYLRSWRFFKSDFIDLLGLFQMDQRFVHIEPSQI